MCLFPAYANTKSTYLQLEAKMFKETLDGKVSNRVPLELEAIAPRAAPQSVPKRRLPTVWTVDGIKSPIIHKLPIK